MKARGLRDLTLAILKGEKTDATQQEQNVAAALVRELIAGSADLHDAFYSDEELSMVVKEVDGSLHVLTTDGKTFAPFDDNAGEPKLHSDAYYLNEIIDIDLRDDFARVMPVSEAMIYEPSISPRP